MSEVSMCTIRGVRPSTPIDPGMHTLTPYFVLHILDTAADREVVDTLALLMFSVVLRAALC